MVARMLHQLTCSDPNLQFKILRTARSHLELGGPARLKYTFPALAFCGLRAIRQITAGGAAQKSDKQSDEGDSKAEAAAPEPTAGATAANAEITPESSLQWLLEVVLQLAEVPAPMQVSAADRERMEWFNMLSHLCLALLSGCISIV